MLSGISHQELTDQVFRINASSHFAEAKQLQAFLDLLASRASSAKTAITQQEIGEILGLRAFDSTKPTVRVAAGRLRSRLVEYYAADGRDDQVIVDFPKGPPYRLNAWKKNSRGLSSSGKAFQHYCEGRILWAQRTPESLKKAVACFEKSIRLNPHSSEPHAALAECYFFMAICGTPPRKVMHQAKIHAAHAVRIDPNSAEGHATLAAVLFTFEWNWRRAGSEFQKAVHLDPSSLPVYSLRANYLLSIGNTDDAAKDAHRILRMIASSPSPLSASHAAKVLYAAGKYDESEDLLTHIKNLAPDFYMVHWLLGLLYGTKGDLRQARKSIERAADLCPENTAVIAALGWIYALAGDTNSAMNIAKQLIANRKKRYVCGTDLAMIYGTLDDMDEAFVWLNRACRERSLFLTWLKVWPPFKPLYFNSRSLKVLRTMGLD